MIKSKINKIYKKITAEKYKKGRKVSLNVMQLSLARKNENKHSRRIIPAGLMGEIEDFMDPHAVIKVKMQNEDSMQMEEHTVFAHKKWLDLH